MQKQISTCNGVKESSKPLKKQDGSTTTTHTDRANTFAETPQHIHQRHSGPQFHNEFILNTDTYIHSNLTLFTPPFSGTLNTEEISLEETLTTLQTIK